MPVETGKNQDAACRRAIQHPFAALPRLELEGHPADDFSHPDDGDCFALWDKYGMLENVRLHSLQVAHVATALAKRACELGITDCVEATRASGLLHDLAKTYCVRYGGSHAMLGAAWTVAETGDYSAARGVLLHVHWPWALPAGDAICCLPIFVLYADKRVRHDRIVTLAARFDDLQNRYGKTAEARAGIRASFEQSQNIERALSACLKWKLYEDSFDSGRLVQ